jgi:protease IV
MSFSTISAVLRGRWLIDKNFAQANLPIAFRLMNGERVDFGNEKNEEVEPVALHTKMASAYAVNYYSDLSRLPQGSIAVVNLAGPLLKYGDMCSWGMIDYAALINRLSNAGNVSGIILNIDSPGGQADGTAMLADTITKARQKKPVVAIIDDGMAASAAMWIASAANEIYVTQPTDMVGSVGVYTSIADWNAHYLDYFKLPVKDIYAPQSTDKNNDYIQALAGDESLIKADLKVLADQFINIVKRNRGSKINGSDWTTGKMFYAKDAIKQGLIDGIKSFEQVIKRVNDLATN